MHIRVETIPFLQKTLLHISIYRHVLFTQILFATDFDIISHYIAIAIIYIYTQKKEKIINYFLKQFLFHQLYALRDKRHHT